MKRKVKTPRKINIDRQGGVVTKSVAPDQLMNEVRMTRRAYELAASSALFRVPQVVDYDPSGPWIKLEYIPDTVPLFFVYRSPTTPVHLFERAGRIVAQLHCFLKLDRQHVLPLPSALDHEGPKSFMHGDLNLVNVRYRAATDELVLFDWSPSPLIGASANWGTVYWDLLFFARATIVSPPIRLTGKRSRWELADRFLQTYVDHSGQGPLDRPFFKYCQEIHRFFANTERDRLTWLRYQRFALLNLASFRRYLDQRIRRGWVFS